jgi:hypothetical protein
MVISPWAKRGFIDHQTLSFDAYLKFIEDDFLHSQRLDPKTDGRPDSRTVVREDVPVLGDLRKDFDFSRPPRPPLLLSLYPLRKLHHDWWLIGSVMGAVLVLLALMKRRWGLPPRPVAPAGSDR